MKSKVVLVLFLFVIWSLLSGWYYVCRIKSKCPVSLVGTTKTASAISYSFNSSEAIVGSSFEGFKEDILSKLGESNVLRIVGLYSPTETNTSAFENMGVARAMAAQSLFSELDASRFKLTSKEQPLTESTAMEALEFYILTKNDFVEETDFGAILHFEAGDVDVDLNPKLDAYLTFLALEKKDKMIDITGYTDNQGDEGENFKLGQVRAEKIKSLLVGKGMDGNRINTTSKGQSEPVAENTTDEGRAANRRVEIHIN